MAGWDEYEELPEKIAPYVRFELLQLVDKQALPFESDETIESAWPTPLDFGSRVPPLWPTDVFPQPVEDFVRSLHVATETPIELAGMIAFSMLATALQGKYHVEVDHGYVEPLNVWTCVALPLGSRKSSVFETLRKPIELWEEQQASELKVKTKQEESLRKLHEERVRSLRRKLVDCKEPSSELLRELADLEATAPDVASHQQLWTTDVTPEALAVLIAKNHECGAVLSDEAGIFDLMAGRYSNGMPNLDIFLNGHATSSVRVNRKGQDPIFIKRPCLTFGISPQPDVIQSLAGKPGFRGRGLLARFLYALPKSNLGYRTLETAPLSPWSQSQYEDFMTTLLDRPYQQAHHGSRCLIAIKLTPEARALWHSFRKEIEPEMRIGQRFAFLTDWAGKLPGAVIRLAGLLHASLPENQEGGRIDAPTMQKAIEVGRVLCEHAVIAFDLMGADASVDGARAILDWIRSGLRTEFTKRDCHHALRRRFPKVAHLIEPLRTLCEHRLTKERSHPEKIGHRPTEWYDVNPKLFDA